MGRCEDGIKFHRAEKLEGQARTLVRDFLARPEEVRRRAEEYVQSERGRLSRVGQELSTWEEHVRQAERKRSTLIDLAVNGEITREEFRTKMAELEGLKRLV